MVARVFARLLCSSCNITLGLIERKYDLAPRIPG